MIEVEKKFRLNKRQRDVVLRRLAEVGASLEREEFEENTLYDGAGLSSGSCVLRLRRVGGKATLTYKKRIPTSSAIKHQREEETAVADPDAMEAILEALGYTPAIVYEKRRQTWILGKTEIVIDVLPFGLFMEIEGRINEIRAVERKLGVKGLRAEHATYPQLTQKHGKSVDGLIEARFSKKDYSRKDAGAGAGAGKQNLVSANPSCSCTLLLLLLLLLRLCVSNPF